MIENHTLWDFFEKVIIVLAGLFFLLWKGVLTQLERESWVLLVELAVNDVHTWYVEIDRVVLKVLLFQLVWFMFWYALQIIFLFQNLFLFLFLCFFRFFGFFTWHNFLLFFWLFVLFDISNIKLIETLKVERLPSSQLIYFETWSFRWVHILAISAVCQFDVA